MGRARRTAAAVFLRYYLLGDTDQFARKASESGDDQATVHYACGLLRRDPERGAELGAESSRGA